MQNDVKEKKNTKRRRKKASTMHRYLISQSCFFLGSSYGGNFAYVCSTCFLYLSLNIWCTVKKKNDVFKYLRCVDTGRTLYVLE